MMVEYDTLFQEYGFLLSTKDKGNRKAHIAALKEYGANSDP